MTLPSIHVVLARPSEPRNIGATCRAAKNFGITRLTIVTDREIDYTAARPLAAGAEDVLETATVVESLAAALEHESLVAGVTRRLGQRRKAKSYAPWEFAALAAERPGSSTAIVFGNEQSGLSDDELEHCHVAVSIPTSDDCPSLNLSHAVEVVSYELYRAASAAADRTARTDTASARDVAAATAEIIASLESLGYHSQEGPQGMRLFVRDLIARASLTNTETTRLRDLFAKLAGMHARGNAEE